MKKKIIASVAAALLATTALADNVIIQNEYVKAGVNETTGTFGSGGGTRPGLQYDSTGTSTFPADSEQGDYLTPGAPFDGFTVDVDGTSYTNNNAGGTDITGAWVGTPSAGSAVWQGGITGVFDITNTYSLPSSQQYIDITSAITAQQAMTTLSFGRFIDPDAMPAAGDTSATDNVLGYGTIPEANVVFSEATVSRYALGLYSTDSNVGAGISSGWSTDPNEYATGGDYAIGTGDHTIGLGWIWTGVSAGDILTANYAYIFGPSAFDAASTAISGGAGGGVDITTGTLVDVGSATDAASGATPDPEPAAPTVVGTTTETITSTSEAVSTTLPVLTASITHHDASDNGNLQTIDREKTTTVTTPIEVTTTSFDRTTTEYSDGSETVTDGAASSTVAIRNDVETTVTDPGSFTGRIDQVVTAQDVVNSTLRVADFGTVAGIAMSNTYDNGMTGTTNGFIAGGRDIKDSDVIVGIGGGKLSTSLSGNGDSSNADTTVVAVTGGKRTEQGDVTVRVAHAMTDYTFNRTIGDFANAGSTSGTDTSVRLQFDGNGKTVGVATIRPVLGVTTGKKAIDGYTETGSIQSARTVASTSEDYTYGTIGASLDAGVFRLTALHNTDGVNDYSIGLVKDSEKANWGITLHRTETDLGTTDSITAGLSIKF